MTFKEVLEFRTALNEADFMSGKALAYAVMKNKDLLDKEIKYIESNKIIPHADYINYENERKVVCSKHSEKDDNGEVMFDYHPNGTQSYKIKDMKKFNKEYKKVEDKYKDAIDDMNKAKEDFDKFINSECKIELVKINYDDLPDDITASFLEKIKFMIE